MELCCCRVERSPLQSYAYSPSVALPVLFSRRRREIGLEEAPSGLPARLGLGGLWETGRLPSTPRLKRLVASPYRPHGSHLPKGQELTLCFSDPFHSRTALAAYPTATYEGEGGLTACQARGQLGGCVEAAGTELASDAPWAPQ